MKPRIILKREALERLQMRRRITDLTLASMAHLNPSQIWRVKQGKSNPGSEFIAGLLVAFPDKKFHDLFMVVDQLRSGQESELTPTGTEGRPQP